ncbi:response regulator [Hyphobacterium sp. HN65]|uniref:histidine kinase n=1 Tax=Hyphobacterium lacteum TaxID=3116575 RepID=A0ABU7LRE2_9PROT|nr:response regulator [Hyphobacterium sp. HN65]MEE2526478.1 response regulator [Hyphobacterium sp. HN65]
MFGLKFDSKAKAEEQKLAQTARNVSEGALEEIDRSRMEIYFRSGLSAAPLNIINGLILAGMLITAAPWLHVAAWLLTGVVLTACRMLLARRALKLGARLPNLQDKLFLALTALSGSIWGVAIFLLPANQISVAHFAVAFIVAGMTAGAALSSATRPIGIIAFNTPAISLIAAWLVTLGSIEAYAMAGALGLYLFVTMRISARYRATLKEAFEANASLEGARTRVETQAKALRELARRHEATAKKGEEAIKAKSAFLASVSHDIKNPLAGIMGVSRRIAEDDTLDTDTRKKTRQIYEAGEMLMRFVGDLRDVSVIESGQLALVPGEITAARLARDTRMLWEPKAKAKDLRFAIHLSGDQDLILAGDSARLKQMLFTYIRNALRYTASGQVDVYLDVAIHSGNARLKAVVEDSGRGVPREAEGRLFKNFFESDAEGIRIMDGTSTGLTITRHLAEMMGGHVGYERSSKGGSKFWFTVELPSLERHDSRTTEKPASAASTAIEDNPPVKAARSPEHGLPNRPLRVLAAEDNAINRTVIEGFLVAKGWSVEFAENGEQALEAAQNKAFDLILMDMRMPVMDGLQATRAIRDLPTTAAMTPIIALTANARREDEAQCLSAGMDGFISKPIDTQRLFETIAGVLSDGPSGNMAKAG